MADIPISYTEKRLVFANYKPKINILHRRMLGIANCILNYI